jgi:hypothetical protein
MVSELSAKGAIPASIVEAAAAGDTMAFAGIVQALVRRRCRSGHGRCLRNHPGSRRGRSPRSSGCLTGPEARGILAG